ncbi:MULTISPECIES: TlpA family protein disulfide reductase [Paenibacillus]|uniref:TlpA family protein disulfide reductase n=1 Tax=Paenibacillus TaxID=44249 RepID=UPI00040E09C8|nr:MULTISPECIES: hypothetical protein [Paenibacillus]UMY54735.1 thioredoxin family protein [Paenibacillus peoriae]
MVFENEIILALLIIISIITLMLLIIIQKIKNNKVVKHGIELGEEIPGINMHKTNGQSINIRDEIKLGKIKVLFFLNADCKECNKILKILNLFKPLKSLKIVVNKSNEEIVRMPKYLYEDNTFFVDAQTLSRTLKINAFPFFVVSDIHGKVIDKGYLSESNLTKYIAKYELI